MLLNKVKTPSDHRAAIRGVMGGETFFKNRQSYTKLLKGRVTANEDVSRSFWLLEPPQIPVSGFHNPEVAGSSPVSATIKKPCILNGYRVFTMSEIVHPRPPGLNLRGDRGVKFLRFTQSNAINREMSSLRPSLIPPKEPVTKLLHSPFCGMMQTNRNFMNRNMESARKEKRIEKIYGQAIWRNQPYLAWCHPVCCRSGGTNHCISGSSDL